MTNNFLIIDKLLIRNRDLFFCIFLLQLIEDKLADSRYFVNKLVNLYKLVKLVIKRLSRTI